MHMVRCLICQSPIPDGADACGVCVTDDLIGLVLKDMYELVEKIGEGNSGEVYRAIHLGLERPVAVKVLRTILEIDGKRVERFKREAHVVSRLNYPHIVSMIDFGRAEYDGIDLYFLVTEFVEGETLLDTLTENPLLPPMRVYYIFLQILSAVEEAHSLGIIHRDLKPDNIILTPLRSGADFVKVFDFGVAAFNEETQDKPESRCSLVGTPGYIAPETIRAEPATQRTDIYTLGCLLFLLLTGEKPFYDRSPLILMMKHLNQEPPMLSVVCPDRDFPPAMDDIVCRALAKKPADRFEGVTELRDAFISAFEQWTQFQRAERPRHAVPLGNSIYPNQNRLQTKQRHRSAVSDTTQAIISRAPPSPSAGWTGLVKDLVGSELKDREDIAEKLLVFLFGEQHTLELVGEAGMGKTSFAKGFERVARGQGLSVYWANPHPRNIASSWHPFQELVAEMLGLELQSISRESLAAICDSEATLKGDPVGLELLFGFANGPNVPGIGERQEAIRESVFEVLGATNIRDNGICVIFDDAHLNDKASLSLIQTLGRAATISKLIIISEKSLLPEDEQLTVVRVSPEGHAPNGDQDENAKIPQPVDPKSNPFYAKQHALFIEEGGVGEGSLSEVISYRAKQLPGETQAIFWAICALGDKIEPAMLWTLENDYVVLWAIEILRQRSLVSVDDKKRVSPVHSLAAKAILDSLSPEEKVSLHLQMFKILEKQSVHVLLLAHFADEAGLEQKAYELFVRAGDSACRLGDHETAALIHYQRAIYIARWRLLKSLEDDDKDYLHLSLRLARALATSSHLISAEIVFGRVADAARQYPEIRKEAETGLEKLAEMSSERNE